MWAYHNYFYPIGPIFTVQEASDILNLVIAKAPPVDGTLGNGARNATIFWMPRRLNTVWVFDRLAQHINEWNRGFQMDLDASPPSFQITKYTAEQKYDWHMDIGHGATSRRKVSMVVGLNDTREFEGGGLEFFYGEKNPTVALSAGDAVIFPSYVMHRAKVVTKGVRWTLAAWYGGTSPFR